MVIGACTVELELPPVTSLKDKRSILKPLLARLHQTFNLAAAEVDLHDRWGYAVLGLSAVSTNASHAQQVLENAVDWLDRYRPDLSVVDHYIEIIPFSSASGQ
jgi:uncharacterized protein YlxP (DUF503 family)